MAAAREAATAAQILLQPMQALQRLRQASRRERRPEFEPSPLPLPPMQQHVQQVMDDREEGVGQAAAAAVSQQQVVSKKRDGMLRRVEVLLHRRQNRRIDAAARSAFAAGGRSPRSSGVGSFAR